MSETSDRRVVVDPELAVRNDIDARILLALWCARKAFFPLLLAGFIVAAAWFIVVDRDAATFVDRMNQMDTPVEVAGAAFSPFVLVAIAFGMRIVVAIGALVAAFPLSLSNRRDDYPWVGPVGRRVRMWWDRWKMSQSYRAFRWTWLVHAAALERLGLGRRSIWARWDRLMVILDIVLAIAFFIVLVIAFAQVPQDVVP